MWRMKTLLSVSVCLTMLSSPSLAQFQNLKPIPLQPRQGSPVVVPAAPVSGFDFDWADVSGATSYKVEITRHLQGGGVLVDSVTSTISRVLYSSDSNPLVPGTSVVPENYSWVITAYQGLTASQPSDSNNFSLIGGTTTVPPKPGPGANPLAPPGNLSPTVDIQYTPSRINHEGLYMQWDPVPFAAGYEVQVQRIKDQFGNNLQNLHYRLDVGGPQALITNLTLFGEYRFEVRTITSGGVRSNGEAVAGFRVVNYQAADIWPPPPDPDGRIDEFDLFTLALNWHRKASEAVEPQADIVSSDGFIEQADLLALIIQFHGAAMSFPPARPSPTPAPLPTPELNKPDDAATFVLNQPGDSINFSWSPVPLAERYELFVRNETTSQEFTYSTTLTEFPITGSQFEQDLAGGGNLTWEVIAKADGFIDSNSVRRSFSVTLTFMKSGKGIQGPGVDWLHSLGGFFLGYSAEAEAVSKDVVTATPPVLLFPYEGQTISTTSPFPLMWEEVPGATTYAVEITLSGIYLNADGYVRDAENLNIVTDTQVGDGIVTVPFFFTFRSKDYRFRVQARFGVDRAEFSPPRKFEIAATSDRPYTNIDYSGDSDYGSEDFFAFASYWFTGQANSTFNPEADLAPAKLDGKINSKDLLSFLGLFSIRDQLPRYHPLPSPELLTPADGSMYGQEAIGKQFVFTWSPGQGGLENFLVWEIQMYLPSVSATPVPKQYFSALPQITSHFTSEGSYAWRVRGLSRDGTRGNWSEPSLFTITLDDYQPELPAVLSPADDQVLSDGKVEFEWTRISRKNNLYAIFDRLEVQNGSGPVYAVDIYRRKSEEGTPAVHATLPLAPSFGNSFRWRVRTFFVIQDTFLRLYLYGPVETPAWHNFSLEGDKKALNGIPAWNADLNADGHINLADGAQLAAAWQYKRSDSRFYDLAADFDMNWIVDQRDAILFSEGMLGNRRLVTNGLGAPLPIDPVEPVEGDPPVIHPSIAARGTTVLWHQIPAIRKYLVEWVDSENNLRGLMADKLESPAPLSPIGDQHIALPAINPQLTLTWSTVPDAHFYSAVLSNLTTGRANIAYVVNAGDPAAPNFSLNISGQDLIEKFGGAGQYEWRLMSIAPGFFADTSEFETFSLSFSKDGSDYFNQAQPIAKKRPGIEVPGSAVLPAFSYYGLYAWRVLGLGDDLSLTLPSRWNRFGIQCLGPAYGYPKFCGQIPPGPG